MRPLDLLNLIMLGVLCTITLSTLRAEPHNLVLLATYMAMGAMLFTYRNVQVPWLDFPRRFRQVYPVVYICVIFDSIARLVPVALAVLGIVVSTVYLRYHYAADVALAALAVWAGNRYCTYMAGAAARGMQQSAPASPSQAGRKEATSGIQ